MEGEEECDEKKWQRAPSNSSHLTFQLISQSYPEHWLNQTSFSVVSKVLCQDGGYFAFSVQELPGNELHELRRVNCTEAQVPVLCPGLACLLMFQNRTTCAPSHTAHKIILSYFSKCKSCEISNNILNVHLKCFLALFCCCLVGSEFSGLLNNWHFPSLKLSCLLFSMFQNA